MPVLLVESVHDGIFTFQVGEPGIRNRWMVDRRSDREITVFVKISLPFDPVDRFIKLIRGPGFEFIDEKENPVSCADEKVEPKGIIERPFSLNPGSRLGSNREA